MITTWSAIGWSMIHFGWIGFVLAALTALLCRGLGRNHPEARCAILTAGLAAMAATPVWLFVTLVGRETASPIVIGSIALGEAAAGAWSSVVSLLPAIWIAGTILMSTSMIRGLVATRELRAACVEAEPRLAALFARLRRELGAPSSTRIAIAPIAAPMALGLLRPVVLLPASLTTGLSARELEWVLIHELSHVRRLDNHVQLFQRAVEAFLFFHPAVWWISGRIRDERELCCDRAALARGGRPCEYVRTLLSFTDRGDQPGPVAASGMAHDRPLTRRVRRLLGDDDRRGRPMRHAVAVAVGLLIVAQSAAFSSFSADRVVGALCPAYPWSGEPASGAVHAPTSKVCAECHRGEGDGGWDSIRSTHASIGAHLDVTGQDCSACHVPPAPAPLDFHAPLRHDLLGQRCSDCHASATGRSLWDLPSTCPADRDPTRSADGSCATCHR